MANTERDDFEWKVVKFLADEGVIRIAEPCVAECHEGGARSLFITPKVMGLDSSGIEASHRQ